MVGICKFKEIPPLEILQLRNGIKVELPDEHLLTPGESFVIKFKNITTEINFTVSEIDMLLPYIGEDEAGIWGGVSVQGIDDYKFLLAAGVALYLSSYCNSKVIDERCFWAMERESDYKRFSDSLKITMKLSADLF